MLDKGGEVGEREALAALAAGHLVPGCAVPVRSYVKRQVLKIVLSSVKPNIFYNIADQKNFSHKCRNAYFSTNNVPNVL